MKTKAVISICAIIVALLSMVPPIVGTSLGIGMSCFAFGGALVNLLRAEK